MRILTAAVFLYQTTARQHHHDGHLRSHDSSKKTEVSSSSSVEFGASHKAIENKKSEIVQRVKPIEAVKNRVKPVEHGSAAKSLLRKDGINAHRVKPIDQARTDEISEHQLVEHGHTNEISENQAVEHGHTNDITEHQVVITIISHSRKAVPEILPEIFIPGIETVVAVDGV